MKLIDWTILYDQYKGLWVALSDDSETVVGSGITAKEALDQARRKTQLLKGETQKRRIGIPYLGDIA